MLHKKTKEEIAQKRLPHRKGSHFHTEKQNYFNKLIIF